MMYSNLGYGVGFGFGWIFMLIFWGLVILAIVYFIRHGNGRCCGHDHGAYKSNSIKNTAMDILKERYAKGEIDKKEFEEKKKDLE